MLKADVTSKPVSVFSSCDDLGLKAGGTEEDDDVLKLGGTT